MNYGARFYDPTIGRFTSTDRFSENFPDQSTYHYAANNPIKFIDINGDSVWVASRALDMPGGCAAVHTFIKAKPDENNPNDNTYFISFYKGEDGKLTGTVKQESKDSDRNESVFTIWGDSSWNTDQEWGSGDLKSLDLIETPENMTDGEFIDNILSEASGLDREEFKYAGITTENNCNTSGNCNSATSTILNNSGVNLERIKKIDPPGYNPGIGVINKRKED